MKINFCTPVNSSSGYSEMGRRLFSIMKQENEIGITDIPHQSTTHNMGPIWEEMRKLESIDAPDFNFINMVPDLWGNFKKAGRNIGCTTFEADRIPDHWVPLMNAMSGIITTSKWNADVMKNCGVKVPILALSPVFVPDPSKPWESGEFKFGASFQWSARKNYVGLIRAFCMAFDSDDAVSLNIKTHLDGKNEFKIPLEIKEIVTACGVRKPPKIVVQTKALNWSQNRDWGRANHAHISLSHGEGWGLPAWEAAEMGQVLTLSNWGAYAEWGKIGQQIEMIPCFETNIYGMDRKISPFFNERMRWAEPDLSSAATDMENIFADIILAQSQVKPVTENLSKHYSMENAKNKLKNFLESIDAKTS